MSEERKPVVCPQGHEMKPIVVNSVGVLRCLGHAYRCECGWTSPPEMSEEAAYTAATATPPNRPLTREQVEAMPDLAAVWCVNLDYPESGSSLYRADDAKKYRAHWIGRGMCLFAAPPAPADIAAAMAGKGEENE